MTVMIRKRYRVQKRSKKNITSSFLFKLTLTCCHFLAIFHNQFHHLLLNVENRCNRTFLYSKVSVKVVVIAKPYILKKADNEKHNQINQQCFYFRR